MFATTIDPSSAQSSMTVFPFSALVGQEQLKTALLLNVISPSICGVLIRGEKGTAKSTAVRALANLLPPIKVVLGCPFSCDPDHPEEFCESCRLEQGRLAIAERPIRIVTLPLNATEDRLAGGIDFSRAIREGRRAFQPGLLARAHRGILYVDEVNLLDDHLVDILLDAASSGHTFIEREGISYSHPSRFVLVGTMNPEEGELRPQLLDRFGLCVEMTAETDPDNRVTLMLRREAFDTDPKEFIRCFEAENAQIAAQILSARALVASVRMPSRMRSLITQISLENQVAGHRADVVIEQAAKAMAAWRNHHEVHLEDILDVAPLALIHRRRESAPPPQQQQSKQQETSQEPKTQEHPHPAQNQKENTDQRPQQSPGDMHAEQSSGPNDGGSAELADGPPSPPEPDKETMDHHPRELALERIFEIGETFRVKKIASPKDRILRRGSGRRSHSRIAMKQGRYIRSTPILTTGDLALDATIRAAAPYQAQRKRGTGLAVVLKPEDLREKIRERRIGNFLLFVVDASGSMGARGRMIASKGAILSLLLDAYQKRDRVGMVSFRKDAAFVNLPPTSSIDLAARLLQELPVGGRTPLSAGLVKTHEVLRNYLIREPTARPIVILITDGRSNVALGTKTPWDETLELAARLGTDSRIRLIVVDTESSGLVQFGMARQLASVMSAQYFKIEDLRSETLVSIVSKEHLSYRKT